MSSSAKAFAACDQLAPGGAKMQSDCDSTENCPCSAVADREATSRRSVFFTTVFPSDFNTAVYGIFLRMRMFLEAAVSVGSVHLVFLVSKETDCSAERAVAVAESIATRWGLSVKVSLWPIEFAKDGKSAWRHLFAPILDINQREEYSGLANSTYRAAIEQLLHEDKAEYVFAHRLSAALFLKGTGACLPPVIFDLDDIEHVKSFRALRRAPARKGLPLLYMQLPALMWGEFSAIRAAKMTFVCSESDASYLKRLWKMPRVDVIPNAVSFPEVSPEIEDGRTMLFIGSYTYEPNVQGAEYLVTAVWPRVRARVPDAKLIIAGNRADRIPSAASSPTGVEFAGFVPDLAEVYGRASVVCCPIFVGGGTRIKIIEAAGYGRAIVSTTIGAEGLELEDGASILLRNDPESFADACVELLCDPVRRKGLGTAARAAVVKRYDRSMVLDRICSLVLNSIKANVPA